MNESHSAKIYRIVAAAARLAPADLGPDAALGVTPNWDSLVQLDILASIEREFGILIEPDEAIELTTLASLIRRVDRDA